MDNKNRGTLLLFLLVFFGAIILLNTFSNVEIKDKAEDIVFAEPIENVTDNITNKTIIPHIEENKSFEPIENDTHPLERQIIKWYYPEDEPTPIPTVPTIKISDNYFNVSMYGGQTIIKNITLTIYNFNEPIAIYLNVNTTAQTTDLEGFTVNLSENKIIINDNQPKNIHLILTAVPNIIPDIFNVNIRITKIKN